MTGLRVEVSGCQCWGETVRRSMTRSLTQTTLPRGKDGGSHLVPSRAAAGHPMGVEVRGLPRKVSSWPNNVWNSGLD